MKSMLDLDYEGRHIQLWPGDSVDKWAKIEHITEQGMIIEFTEIKANGYNQHYNVGDVMFWPWNSLKFIFKEER
jgi:hypothetical protein|tara:strand:- start:2327 stop:2548 length:222 start_codon:yes stop_codon:yes gene_type:complete